MENPHREKLLLASYAMQSEDSAGREHDEPEHPYRSPYQRDRDRILHSAAFRRLAHKTQVFTGPLISNTAGGSDDGYYRSRLTHTFEVASVARTVARALGLNEDLVEALALVHDIGHPPFGHAGEDVLNERLGGDADTGQSGFNHNAQAVRIVTRLEQRYPGVRGLNLTREVLDGQTGRSRKSAEDVNASPPSACSPLLEVQTVDAADSIAYDAHDADDALELGMISLGELNEVPLWAEAVGRVRSRYAALSEEELRRATIHELLDWQVSDLLASTRALLIERRVHSVEDARQVPTLVTHSAELAERKRELESFLFTRVYRHPRVLAHRMEATAALGDLFDRVLAAGSAAWGGAGSPFEAVAVEESAPRAAADYAASVTDRYALEPLEGAW